jgi:tetratricopeptide (TPR) repeat protein
MYYDKILEVDPNYMQVWEDKAYAFCFLERYSEANECLDKALSLSSASNPDNYCLYKAKAYILNRLGRPNEADKKADEATFMKILYEVLS